MSGEKNHFKYILFEYNIMCDWADTVNSQMIDGVKMTMIEACKALELETVASMPFAMGDGFKKYALSDMLDFVLKKDESRYCWKQESETYRGDTEVLERQL